ncbi:class I adenylate-forming enzyme family protein [Brevibacterium sp. FAM 25378]|uniref:class I adenylate-forming enzyme family protein n=1 Tax=unclassified Brevibacterium TaxID=2614124 RepID=UPI00197A954F|nr:AMP-binding protein [Brevibacterium sp. S22]
MTSTPTPASAQDISTFAQLWAAASERVADREFLLFREKNGDVPSWTYGEFDAIVDKVAATLVDLGVRPGSSIHLCLKNCPGFIALWLAAARIGAWIVPVDPASAKNDITTQISRVAPVLGICSSERAEVYRQGAVDYPQLPIIDLTETSADLFPGAPLVQAPDDLVGRADVVESGRVDKTERIEPKPVDRLAVMFTSGTTSQPKGVVLTQANYLEVAERMAEAADLEATHRWYVTLPLFHANAQYYCFSSAIRVGASVALTADFSASRWVEWARELEVTHASLFAAPIRMILARTPAKQVPAELEHVWYAQNLAPDHHAVFAGLVGVAPRQLYGMTETIAIVSYDRSRPPRSEVIGQPLPNRRVELLDPVDRRPAAAGQIGMIAVAGERGRDLFLEYLDDPSTTAKAFHTDEEGTEWLLTGDLARRDERGILTFVGRVDDVIKVSGENVSLTEVEAALAQAPGVLEVAVVAVPDPIRDVVPHAYVVPADATSGVDIDQLKQWAEENLAPAARPREWHILDELPRTSVGKIRRFKIGAQAQKAL